MELVKRFSAFNRVLPVWRTVPKASYGLRPAATMEAGVEGGLNSDGPSDIFHPSHRMIGVHS